MAEEKTLAEKIIKEWKESPTIRAEFKDLSCFAAFREAEAKGKIKIMGGVENGKQ